MELRDLGWLPFRFRAITRVPHEDQTRAFQGRPSPDVCPTRNTRRVRDLTTHAISAIGPSVKRATDALPRHHASDAEVRTKVRTVRIEHLRFARLRAEQHQLLPEV